jgi:hypothetical protein
MPAMKKILTVDLLLNTIKRDGLVYDWSLLTLLSIMNKETLNDPARKTIIKRLFIRFFSGLILFILVISLAFYISAAQLMLTALSAIIFFFNNKILKRSVLELIPGIMQPFMEKKVTETTTLYQFAEFVAKETSLISLLEYLDRFERIKFVLVGGSFLLVVFIYPINFFKGLTVILVAYLFCRFITFHNYLRKPLLEQGVAEEKVTEKYK